MIYMAALPKIRAELLAKIQQLSEKHQLSLHRQVQKVNDLANLRAILTEARFGLFFDEHCENLQYDKAVFNGSLKTPDWCLQKNGQTIIAEVYRLNPADEDQRRSDAESQVIEEFQKENPGVPVFGTTHIIHQQPLKLTGENGAIAVKSEKYGPLAEANNYPFIICLYFDFISGQDKLELFTCLYGRSCEFGGRIAHPDFPLGTRFHDLTDAMFYDHEQTRKNVSGILLKTENEFIYFHNYSPYNRLSEANVNWLQSFAHDYDTF